ncbi:MAG: hypothetical protein ACR2KM_04625 [Gemmatimonadaceae bacterium]
MGSPDGHDPGHGGGEGRLRGEAEVAGRRGDHHARMGVGAGVRGVPGGLHGGEGGGDLPGAEADGGRDPGRQIRLRRGVGLHEQDPAVLTDAARGLRAQGGLDDPVPAGGVAEWERARLAALVDLAEARRRPCGGAGRDPEVARERQQVAGDGRGVVRGGAGPG